MTPTTLQDRVIAYNCFDLPGQPMSVHMGTSYLINDLLKAVEALTKERDELRIQIDIQAGSIEAVQSANQRLAANHKECVRCLGEALQDTTNLAVERDALASAAKLALEALVDCAEWEAADDPQRPATEAITALRQAGVQ